MEDPLSLIDGIIEDHKQIMKETRALEHDLDAALELEKAADDFVPASFDPARRSLQSLRDTLDSIDRALDAHFRREETALLRAIMDQGSATLASSLRELLHEHQQLRDRIAKSKQDASELALGGTSRELWEGRAHGVRVYMNHTRKLLEAHARSEHELLQTARKDIEARMQGGK